MGCGEELREAEEEVEEEQLQKVCRAGRNVEAAGGYDAFMEGVREANRAIREAWDKLCDAADRAGKE